MSYQEKIRNLQQSLSENSMEIKKLKRRNQDLVKLNTSLKAKLDYANETKDIDNKRIEELVDDIQRRKRKATLLNEKYLKELEMRKALDADFRVILSVK